MSSVFVFFLDFLKISTGRNEMTSNRAKKIACECVCFEGERDLITSY